MPAWLTGRTSGETGPARSRGLSRARRHPHHPARDRQPRRRRQPCAAVTRQAGLQSIRSPAWPEAKRQAAARAPSPGSAPGIGLHARHGAVRVTSGLATRSFDVSRHPRGKRALPGDAHRVSSDRSPCAESADPARWRRRRPPPCQTQPGPSRPWSSPQRGRQRGTGVPVWQVSPNGVNGHLRALGFRRTRLPSSAAPDRSRHAVRRQGGPRSGSVMKTRSIPRRTSPRS